MAKYLETDISQRFGPGGVTSTELPVTRILRVDGGRTDPYTEAGTEWRPFRTVQQAVDFAEANMAPSHTNPVEVFITPKSGGYSEDVVIKKSGVNLSAHVGQGVTRIRRLILTNATSESLDDFIDAGGLAAPAANYGSLNPDTDYPWDNQFRDLAFGNPSGGDYGIYIMGVGAGTSICGNEAGFMRCTNYNKSFFRLCNYLAIQNDCWLSGDVETHNIAGLWLNRTQTGNYIGFYDSGEDEPSDAGNYGLCGGPGSLVYGSVTLNSEAKIGYDRLDGIHIASALTINGSSGARMEGGLIGGSVTVAGDASFRLRGVHVQGNLTLENAGGLVGCTMDGGKYMGALTDVGARLTRNTGS